MKPLILIALLLLFVPQSGLKTEYDRFRDETQISTSRQSVDIKGLLSLDVAAYFIYKGPTVTPDGIMGLTFYSSSQRWRFLNNNELIALVNGERIVFGEPAAKDARLARRTGVKEVLDYELTREQLRKLAGATMVEMQLGSAEFKLKEKFLRALKELDAALPSEVVK